MHDRRTAGRHQEAGRPPSGRLSVGLFGLLDAVTLPKPSLGPQASLGASWGSLEVALRGKWLPRQHQYAAAAPDRGGDFGVWAVEISPCFLPWQRRWAGGICAGVEFGQLSADGVGTQFDAHTTSLWSAGSLALLVRYAWTEVMAVEVRTDGTVPLTRPEFVLTNVGPVYQPGYLGLRAAIGLTAHFP